jgi:hypothetical protein
MLWDQTLPCGGTAGDAMQTSATSRSSVDAMTEAKAIADVVEALKDLDTAAITRVLDWASKRYGAHAAGHRALAPAGPDAPPYDGEAAEPYGDVADLYTAASPRTESESVLVAAYWHQVVGRTESLDSQALNGDLKNLGHGVRNVTRACSVLIHQRPALMMQVKKAGATKQARKQYRLTAAGIQRVREMLAEREQGGAGA